MGHPYPAFLAACHYAKVKQAIKQSDMKEYTMLTDFWAEFGPTQIYYRIIKRYVTDTTSMTLRINCIDIANIIIKEKFQRKGIFKNILSRIEQLGNETNRYVYIENVHNEYLHEYFTKRKDYLVKEKINFIKLPTKETTNEQYNKSSANSQI